MGPRAEAFTLHFSKGATVADLSSRVYREADGNDQFVKGNTTPIPPPRTIHMPTDPPVSAKPNWLQQYAWRIVGGVMCLIAIGLAVFFWGLPRRK